MSQPPRENPSLVSSSGDPGLCETPSSDKYPVNVNLTRLLLVGGTGALATPRTGAVREARWHAKGAATVRQRADPRLLILTSHRVDGRDSRPTPGLPVSSPTPVWRGDQRQHRSAAQLSSANTPA